MHARSDHEVSRRTTALALWRYGHDYLKAAQLLGETDHVTCEESQALYHLAAQGIEFALKACLRSQGVPQEALSHRIGHSLLDALQESLARGLPSPPVEVIQTIQTLAPHLRDDQFLYLPAQHGEFPDLAPLISAGVWILSHIADNVVVDYYIHHGRESVTERVAMVRRLHADLDVTARKIPRLQ